MEGIIGWDFVGWVVAFLIPLAVAVITMKQPATAKVFFGVAACVLAAKLLLIGWLAENTGIKIVISLTLMILAAGLFACVRWIDRKVGENQAQAGDAVVSQTSYGAGSPNIIGDHNTVGGRHGKKPRRD